MTESDRSCGTCYACCVHLGIAALKKRSGQACRYLDGTNSTKRCSIYEKRPDACKIYQCAWRSGAFLDNMRPDESGILVTPYPLDEDPNGLAATILIIDEAKAGTINHPGNLQFILNFMIAQMGAQDIRVVNGKKILHFRDGVIRKGHLLKTADPEALRFAVYDPPLGRYDVKENPNGS